MISRLDQTKDDAQSGEARSRIVTFTWVLAIGGLLTLLYTPLLLWLGYAGFQVDQLSTGGVLVLFALFISIRGTLQKSSFKPEINTDGLMLLTVGIGCLALAPYLRIGRFVLVLVSFCISFAAVVAFLFGRKGVRQFIPSLTAILVFGLMAALFPRLDWPLRATAARYAVALIDLVGLPVELLVDVREAPQLLLIVPDRVFVVATECNGFGLLTSSFLLAAILVFQFRLPWQNKIGLILLAAPIAIGCNFLRIVSIALIAPRINIPYMWLHEALGLVFYYLGLGLIWFFADRRRQALQEDQVTPPPKPPPTEVEVARSGSTPARRRPLPT